MSRVIVAAAIAGLAGPGCGSGTTFGQSGTGRERRWCLRQDGAPGDLVIEGCTGLGHVEQALHDFDPTIALDPGYESALYNRSSMHQSRTELDRTIADDDRAAALAPEDARIFNKCGKAGEKLVRRRMARPTSRMPSIPRLPLARRQT